MLVNSVRCTEAGEMCCAMMLHWLDAQKPSKGLPNCHRHIMQVKGSLKGAISHSPESCGMPLVLCLSAVKHQTPRLLKSHHLRLGNRVQTSS